MNDPLAELHAEGRQLGSRNPRAIIDLERKRSRCVGTGTLPARRYGTHGWCSVCRRWFICIKTTGLLPVHVSRPRPRVRR